MKPYVIFFVGSTGVGKTDMAYYLSEQFGLPIFSTDAVRRDAKVSKDVVDIHDAMEEFESAREARVKAMFGKAKSFIIDASADRKWSEYKKMGEDNGFKWSLISFDVSKGRIMKNKEMFDQIESDELFDRWIADHQIFLDEHSQDINLHITDDNYAQRYQMASELVKNTAGN